MEWGIGIGRRWRAGARTYSPEGGRVPAADIDGPQKGDESRHASRGAYSFTGPVR